MDKHRQHRIRTSRQKGFTLVEMLIVAALIALFAGLAVINIQQQYELNKQKASVAECRQIGTAMTFALQDLGFFPKICFLRFNYNMLVNRIQTLPLDQFEYHGLPVGNIVTRLTNQWSRQGQYAAFNFDKLAYMRIPGDPGEPYEWPADPWRNPYVAYFVQTQRDPNSLNVTQRFINRAGEKADYFAGIVSYGRNGVPGLTESPQAADLAARKDLRLYKETGQFNVYLALTPAEYDAARVSQIVAEPANPDPARPRIRDTGSDDRYFEF